jgi:magnesium chelatase subunit I
MDRKVTEATQAKPIQILPYSQIVGQERLKMALELAYIAPRLGGVLIMGQRGTAKSTAVRAFANMVYDRLPVTLPINATEDRVIGGWQIDELMRGEAKPQPGLLEEADEKLLYIDEVNLLDDHIVNLILDVSSTGVLVVQREGIRDQKPVSFTLVGTMNPEEGSLRPQLLDRFGLMVSVTAEKDETTRSRILQTVIDFDHAVALVKSGRPSKFLELGRKQDKAHGKKLNAARNRFYQIDLSEEIAGECVKLAGEFNVEGHRGDYVMALAARAMAALEGEKEVNSDHLRKVAPLALQHRRREFLQSGQWIWTPEDDDRLAKLLHHA